MSLLPVLDNRRFHEIRELMGDQLAPTIESYAADSKRLVSDIMQAFESTNAKDMVLPAHTLKSSSGQFGALRLAETARSIEQGAKMARSPAEIIALSLYISKLESQLQETLKMLEYASKQSS